MSDSILFSRYFPYKMTTLHIYILFLLFYYFILVSVAWCVLMQLIYRFNISTYSCSIFVFRCCFCPMLFSEIVIWYFWADWQWLNSEHWTQQQHWRKQLRRFHLAIKCLYCGCLCVVCIGSWCHQDSRMILKSFDIYKKKNCVDYFKYEKWDNQNWPPTVNRYKLLLGLEYDANVEHPVLFNFDLGTL